MGATGGRFLGYYAIKMVHPGDPREGGRRKVEIASVRARDMTQAIAVAMRRYPGYLAVHGERH